MTNKYGLETEQMILRKYEDIITSVLSFFLLTLLQRKTEKRSLQIKDTHSSVIQKRYIAEKMEKALLDSPKDLFKMRRFKAVEARVSPRGSALKKAGEQTMKLA